jgi:hypothetical protein
MQVCGCTSQAVQHTDVSYQSTGLAVWRSTVSRASASMPSCRSPNWATRTNGMSLSALDSHLLIVCSQLDHTCLYGCDLTVAAGFYLSTLCIAWSTTRPARCHPLPVLLVPLSINTLSALLSMALAPGYGAQVTVPYLRQVPLLTHAAAFASISDAAAVAARRNMRFDRGCKVTH